MTDGHHARLRARHERWHQHERRHPRSLSRLRKQMFLSFGVAIAIAMSITAWLPRALPHWVAGTPVHRLLVYVVVGLFIWAIAGMWAHRVSAPLRELTRVAGELGKGKLDSRVHLPRRNTAEVHELGVAFNEMAASIEAHVNGKNELLHAVSHELRTPLARLRVLLGILSDRTGQDKLTEDLEREVLELDALVGELLAGARIDAGALQRRALSVQETVITCFTRTGLEGAQLIIEPGAEQAHADPTLLARALIVLLDNAKKHGGSNLTVRVSKASDGTRFCVEDDGAGFEESDLPRLFMPFARGRGEQPDEARGLGLGLYLVRRIAQAHQGEAFAQNGANGGATVGFSVSNH